MLFQTRFCRASVQDTARCDFVECPGIVTHRLEQYGVRAIADQFGGQLLEGAELLTVGARFGRKIRLDFAVEQKQGSKTADLSQKADNFSEGILPAHVDGG